MTIDDLRPRTAVGRALRVRAHLRIELDVDGVIVVGEDGLTTIRGRAVAEVVALLDGHRDLTDLVAAAAGGVAPAEVVTVVEQLDALGFVETAAVTAQPTTAFHIAAGAVPSPSALAPRVALHDLGDAAAARAVAAALDHALLPRDTSGDPADVAVVVVADYLDPRLGELDASFRAAGMPWLPVRPSGVRQWIGPFFGATADGPCWHCLAARLWGHRRTEEAWQASRDETGPLPRRLPAHPGTLAVSAGAVALEIDSWAHGVDRPVRRGVWVHDARSMTGALHELRRRPQCGGCGEAGRMARLGQVPVRLGGGPPVGDGDETLAGYRHLVSSVTGVVPTLDVVEGPVRGSYLARTGPTPPARPLPLDVVRQCARTGNGGSGASDEAARTSGLGEALERWCGQFHGDEYRIRARRVDLSDDAVDPRDCLLVDPRQSADHTRWNAEHGLFNHVGPPADDEAETDWSPLWSLRDGARRWLPTAMLYHGAPGPTWAWADSNGCAAGPTRDEAIRRGLLELVERDAVALWWYHRTSQPGLDLHGHAEGRTARSAHDALGREVWALDLTSDLGVPVVAALSGRRRSGGRLDRVTLGFGADPEPATALRRALGELAALLPHVLTGARPLPDPDGRRWVEQVDTDGEPWLLPAEGRQAEGRQAPPLAPVGPARGVAALVDRLVGHGLDPLVLDQTRPDVGLPVVRTVVPTLRPMWARFAPGRLFDVPVALGRLEAATPYEKLNPRPVFL